jgi:hypothetical protein
VYYIETNIVCKLLGITKRQIYNYRYGRYTASAYYPPIMNIDDIVIFIVKGKQVSYMTQNGFESILNN